MEFDDFINDPMFVRWVTSSDPDLDAHWKRMQAEKPEIQPSIAAAKKLVLAMRFDSEYMSEAAKAKLWDQIKAQAFADSPAGLAVGKAVVADRKTSELQPKKMKLYFGAWLRTAAAILLFGLIGLLYFTQRKVALSTEYGQRRSIELPDGSKVVLNANSTIRYSRFWGKNKLREVWISGEAFFKVNHLHTSGKVTDGERFIVHAGHLNVAVLGTSFNVNNRRNRIRVALLSGKVGLDVEGSNAQRLNLSPGELGEYQNQTRRLDKKQVDLGDYLGWRSGRLTFHNTTLKEALWMIEDVYGYKAILNKPELGNRRLSGNFLYINSESSVFKILAVSLGLSIEKDLNSGKWIIDYKGREN